MASTSLSEDAAKTPTLVEEFVPPEDKSEASDDFQSAEQAWELERDLALHNATAIELDEKKAMEDATKHTNSRGILNTSACASSNGLQRKQTKNDSLFNALCAVIVEHQVGLSINLMLLLALTHGLFPRARPLTRKFFELSYYDASIGKYRQGMDDAWFVVFWIVAFTGLRAGVMDYILKPLARAGGIRKDRVRLRFAEQAWLVIYDSISWSLGMYVMYHSEYWFNLRETWTHFPTSQMDGIWKFYYLVQFAFWLQQIVVVNIEERRKDYAQMFTHHIFTSILIVMSYGSYQMKVGTVILCIMDPVDVLLSAAKCLKYLGFTTICDVMFGLFVVAWFVCRHVFYVLVCWSIYTDNPAIIGHGCFEASTGAFVSESSDYPGADNVFVHTTKGWTDPDGVVCYSRNVHWTYMALLLGLQVILLTWFYMIVCVVWRVLMGYGADDSRSDDEGEAHSEEEDVDVKRKTTPVSMYATQRPPSAGSSGSQSTPSPYEEEVGVDQMYHLGTRRSASPRVKRKRSGAKGRTSAISIPGHSDPKDILNRIGCETKTTDQD